MQLKRLEAYGFKSFADKIGVEFDKGITAIVGPNGSGKSNISDAIKWVLGEQNIRNLRGTKAEDIIFTGSESRRAMGVAEVSLYFDNDGTLPIEFNEVVVTRRLFRNGESEFYINKARCRLKDINNLFADSGIGHDSMGIISQNKMDEILNAKPEERRLFFEEAAGITKYRNRKKESMRKLEDTEKNLQRVEDILGEIENQLEPLAQSAEKTAKYQGLQKELQELQLTAMHHHYGELLAARQKFDVALQEKKDQEVAASTAVQLTENRKVQLDKELLDLEQEITKISQEKNAIHSQLEESESQIKVLEERRTQEKASRQRIQAQLHETKSSIAELQQEMKLCNATAEETTVKLAKVTSEIQDNRKKAKQFRENLASQKSQLDQLVQEQLQRQNKLVEYEHQIQLLQRDIDSDSQVRQERQQQIQSLSANKEKLEAEVKLATNQQNTIDEQMRNLQAEYQQAIYQKDELNKKINLNTEARKKLEQNSQVMESRLQMMERLQQSYEGFGRAVKTVLKSQAPWRHGVCGAVAELLQVPGQYIVAIETALGGSQQNIVTENTDIAKSAIGYLKQSQAGRATFLPLSSITIRSNRENLPQGAKGIIGWCHEVVEVADKYNKVAEFLLGRTLLVDTLDNALVLAKAMQQRIRIVTLEGELLSPGGSLAGGSRQHKESSFLNRSEEIKKLQITAKETAVQLAEVSQQLAEEQQNLAIGMARIEELQATLHQMELAQKELSVSLQGVAGKLTVTQGELAELVTIAANSDKNFQLLTEERNDIVQKLARLKTEEEQQGKILVAEKESYNQQDNEAEELAQQTNQLEMNRTVLEQQGIRLREQLMLRQRTLNRNLETSQNCEQEIAQLEHSLEESRQSIGKLLDVNQRKDKEYAAIGSQYDKLYQHRMNRLADNQKNDKEYREASQRLAGVQNQLHKLELDASKVVYDLEQCQEEMLANYGLVPERVAEVARDLEPVALKRQLRATEQEISALGNINLNALEEYQELQKRHGFMEENKQDLTKGKDDLLQLIGEMEVTMSQQFATAFAQINKHFGQIFVELFGGGQAELILTDKEQVLESGVTIIVTIPGKKTQNLAVLSGGERSLTVVALLFAFLCYRPAPFSVLDEIDAPLDEANINRFGTFLREYAERTQFIVVTHRKGTMEAADAMYGVTIEDAGVSKVLSVRLKDKAVADLAY